MMMTMAIEDPSHGVKKVRVSGVDVKIIAERVEYLGPDGKLITESYSDYHPQADPQGVCLPG